MIRVFKDRNVYEEALARIRWIMDEFPTVAVSMSGGKDSTVLFELASIVAAERGIRLPVLWLDQECEFAATVDYMREVLHRPHVDPYWFQIPFRLMNATSGTDNWLNVWGDGEEWVRDKEPDSIHENVYGTDRFQKLLFAIADHHFPGGCVLTGMRIEESPSRLMALTAAPTYKWVTWGTKQGRRHITLAPLYDWSYRDIWKAIHEQGWVYNRIYDEQYRWGVSIRDMRVSNYHHETAVHHLFYLQEVEPETYERATARISGIATAAHLGKGDFFVKELPFMFQSWREYRDYLVQMLVPADLQGSYHEAFAQQERLYPRAVDDAMMRLHVQTILANDSTFTKLRNFHPPRHLRDVRKKPVYRFDPDPTPAAPKRRTRK